MIKKSIRRIVVPALLGAAALMVVAGHAAAQSVPDTLVTGKISPASAGQTVSVKIGGTVCATIAGGTTAADGTYQVVVNCAAGNASLFVNGVDTGATFTLTPGTQSDNVNATLGAPATPTATATTPPPATTATPAPPKAGDSAPSGGDSTPWLAISLGLGLVALGLGGAKLARQVR